MFAVEFMERIAALSVDTTLAPVANMLTDTVCYIVNSPRRNINETYPPSLQCTLMWDERRGKYIPTRYLPICEKV